MSTRTLSSRRPPRLAFVAIAFALSSLSSSQARADDDPMAPYRERFRAGMDRYKAGDLPTAIAGWEAIYREVGPEKGYRVAFDLGRAYDAAGDAAHARERYVSFLQVVDQRRAAGVSLEGIVLQEESEARGRVAAIGVEVTAPQTGATAAAATAPGAGSSAASASTSSPTPLLVLPTSAPPAHPFSPAVPFVAGGATLVAAIITIVEYTDALSQENAFNAAAGQAVSVQNALKSTYDGTRSRAYGSLGASIGLAAVTAGLSVWYFAATKKQEPQVIAVFGATPGGAGASIVGHF